ncbi:ATP-binding protein [Hahella aquimaris]|uniref:sensor histidine kinase n=1 Tax=Hahella sp. HNIBRBA332 TaxID=3015983 RepID=UPI00273C3917|nr:sensor histidine kinase [Hahella sp. HNIBRBA332]WLQ13754.1 ATP-binding protein [Hahella sp. HNIBRBA332]
MNFSAWSLLAYGALYLSALFGLAYITERGWIPLRWVRHPATYVLSLGVYASAWAFYGSVGLAYEFGYGFLAFYLGVCGAFLLAPVLLIPVLRVTKSYQLSSIADLFTFRYRSQAAGTISTLFISFASLALLALQFQALDNSLHVLAPSEDTRIVSLLFCGMIIFFAIFFGARGQTRAERHPSLIVAIALEGGLKLVIILALAILIAYQVFGGFGEVNSWLQENAQRISAMERHLEEGPWRAMLLIFFASALVMPHMFHVTFTENLNPTALYKASWGLPVYLLLMSLPIPIFMWAGIKLSVPTTPEFFILGLGQVLNAPWISIVAFLGGLTAASGLLIVTCLALASMMLNHVILPVYQPLSRGNIYSWLTWVRRGLILFILGSGYLFSLFLDNRFSLSELGILAFSAGLQLLPGVMAVIYWPLGNRNGFISGLCAGVSLWFVTMPLPILFGVDVFSVNPWRDSYSFNPDDWHYYVMASLTLNIFVFVMVSLFTDASQAEARSAQACSVDTLMRPSRRELVATSSEQFKDFLTESLGRQAAEREVNHALAQLQLHEVEYRPYALRRLRDQIEANLSGLLGPALAQDIVKQNLSFKPATSVAPAQDIYFVESKLEEYHNRLSGLAGELDTLRRYHRQTLQNLPIATCSLGADLEVLMWNHAMEQLTGISAPQVIGSHISAIAKPWSSLLFSFANAEERHVSKKRLDINGSPHWFNLHKAAIESDGASGAGQVLLLEDYTETQLLEDELVHSERLASVGRLAAGVAHEIGNPVTGIACLAQNLKLMTSNEEVLETAGHILVQTQRVSRILQTLMNFARSGNYTQSAQHGPTELKRCVDEAIHLLSLSTKEPQVLYVNEVDETVKVMGDGQRLVQVFVNLLSNARDASEASANIWVRATLQQYSIHVEVEDEGSGINGDQIDHLFEPFYTTKGPDKGTGLGLSLVYSIIEEHYGHIRIESPADKESGKGTRVIIELPAYQSDSESISAELTET